MGLKDRIVCKAKHFLDDWALPLFVGGTIGAAWGGYFAAFKNHADNKKTNERLDHLSQDVYHNGSCGAYDRKRIERLEENNRILMRKALETTEGKESAA